MPGFRETKSHRTISSNSHSDYHIKAIDLGSGPRPESVFVNLVKGASKDGEAWLDSAKVSSRIASPGVVIDSFC